MPPLDDLHLHQTNGAFDTWWTFESAQEFPPGMHTIEVHDLSLPYFLFWYVLSAVVRSGLT